VGETLGRLVERLEAEARVRRVAAADRSPRESHRFRRIALEGETSWRTVEGRPGANAPPSMPVARVDVDFFDALGQPILGGRGFGQADVADSASTVIVNTRFVELRLAGRNPIGQRIRFWEGSYEGGTLQERWYEIVGVVGPLGMNVAMPEQDAGVYLPAPQGEIHPLRLAVHLDGSPETFAPRLREIVGDVDPRVILQPPRVLGRVFQGVWYFHLGTIACLAVIVGILVALAASGIYAIMSFAVSERTREIGIRSLGERTAALALRIGRRSLVQITLGALLGVGPAVALFRLTELGYTPPAVRSGLGVALAAGVLVALAIGLLACVSPTRRALRIEVGGGAIAGMSGVAAVIAGAFFAGSLAAATTGTPPAAPAVSSAARSVSAAAPESRSAPAIRHSRVPLPTGVELHVAEAGSADGEPVLFLHGYTDSWLSWSPVLERLPDGIRAIVPTQRGHGDSGRPPCCYRFADFSTDVVALMDVLGIARATVVGYSMGSFVAQHVAIDYPERVSRLVLVGSGATIRTPVLLEFADVVRTLADPVDPAFIREFQAGGAAMQLPDAFLDGVVAESGKLPARVWRGVAEGLLAGDAKDALHRIAAPTLVVWGPHDALFGPSDQDALLRALPTRRLVVYEGSGHSPHWEMPGRFAADLAAFIDEADSASLEAHGVDGGQQLLAHGQRRRFPPDDQVEVSVRGTDHRPPPRSHDVPAVQPVRDQVRAPSSDQRPHLCDVGQVLVRARRPATGVQAEVVREPVLSPGVGHRIRVDRDRPAVHESGWDGVRERIPRDALP
jgi:pimeloyl-ACP methyl ester carboxylesterase